MNTPEVPKQKPTESAEDALQNLRSDVQLPPEAADERDRVVDVLAGARDDRIKLIKAMKQEKNIPKANLRKLEMVLTA